MRRGNIKKKTEILVCVVKCNENSTSMRKTIKIRCNRGIQFSCLKSVVELKSTKWKSEIVRPLRRIEYPDAHTLKISVKIVKNLKFSLDQNSTVVNNLSWKVSWSVKREKKLLRTWKNLLLSVFGYFSHAKTSSFISPQKFRSKSEQIGSMEKSEKWLKSLKF